LLKTRQPSQVLVSPTLGQADCFQIFQTWLPAKFLAHDLHADVGRRLEAGEKKLAITSFVLDQIVSGEQHCRHSSSLAVARQLLVSCARFEYHDSFPHTRQP